MNFTEEIKREITSEIPYDRECALAAFSAFVRTSGSIITRNGEIGFEIVTENEYTAEYFSRILEEVFSLSFSSAGVKSDAGGRDKLTFECVGSGVGKLLREFGVLSEEEGGFSLDFGISEELTKNERSMAAYLVGAFLGGGSCTVPEEGRYSRTGYHFEIIFSNRKTAGDFCELLCGFEVLAKLVARKDCYVVYVKSKEVISDLLHIMSADGCLQKLNRLVELKDRTNNENRINNCSVSNIDKTVTASVRQVLAIEIISQTIGLKSIDGMLFDVAAARLADKNASMQELADRLGISKSCLNHRMRKLSEIAKSLDRD